MPTPAHTSPEWCIVANVKQTSPTTTFRHGAKLTLTFASGGAICAARSTFRGKNLQGRTITAYLGFVHLENFRPSFLHSSSSRAENTYMVFETKDEAQRFIDINITPRLKQTSNTSTDHATL